MPERKIVLASSSPARKEVLEREGYDFDVVPSDYEEKITGFSDPVKLVKAFALGKAEDVAKRFGEEIVIGADTVVVLDGKILGKPHTAENAQKMLVSLSGRQHSVYSGFAIIDCATGLKHVDYAETRVFFRNLTETEIDNYVATGEPLEKAGSYSIHTGARDFVIRVEGSFSNVMGLPIEKIKPILDKL